MLFEKGNNANPIGRGAAMSRKSTQLKEMLLHCVPKAVELLEIWLRDNSDKDTQKFAVKEILDRVYGKAPQALQLDTDIDNALSITVNVTSKVQPIDVTNTGSQPVATTARRITDGRD